MCFKNYLFPILLLSFLIGVNSIERNPSHNQARFNDFVIGDWTINSRIAFTSEYKVDGIPNQLVNGSWSWQGARINITLIEGLDLNENGTGGIVTGISNGGLGSRGVTLDFISSTIGEGIHFVIYIVAESDAWNDFIIGALRPTSTLLYETDFFVPGSYESRVFGTFVYSGKEIIHMVEGVDLSSNDNGGSLLGIDIVGFSNSTALLLESDVGEPINFKIRVHGANE